MEDQYGMGDLRQYMNGRPLLHGIQQSQDLCLNPSHPYDMLVFRLDNNTANHNNNNSASAAATTSISHHHLTTVHDTNNNSDGCNNNAGLSHVLESTANIVGDVNCGNNNGRWPRQETLTLLEIRSRLDTKFKEANQKGPLWDEVSRIMAEEHGYQRSGKKCREKFENLYKYYKKTKEGKAGRQDGKHYRFFRQLEALYGESQNSNSAHFVGENFNYNFPNSNNHHLPLASNNQEASQCHNKLSDISLSLSNCSETDTTSSEDSDNLNVVDENDPAKKQRRCKKSWKVKIKDFIDAQMKKLMDKQEAWMEKMVKAIEQTEQERILREEEWRKQDAARIEREHAFWARERAWIEARDTVLMDALHKFSVGNKDHHRLIRASPDHQEEVVIGAADDIRHEDVSETIDNKSNNNNPFRKGDIWPESEMSRLIQLRSAMEVKFQQRLASEDVLWEEVANKMACFGHDRSGLMCKDKWDNVNNYAIKTCNKKRKENSPSSKSCTNPYYLNNHESVSSQGGGGSSSAYFGGSNEQKVDDVMRLNEHHGNIIPSSLNNNNHNNAENSVSDSCFRYFMGDAYGRMIG